MSSFPSSAPSTSLTVSGSSVLIILVTMFAGDVFFHFLFGWLSPDVPSWEMTVITDSLWLMSGDLVILSAVLLFLAEKKLRFHELGLRPCGWIWVIAGGLLAFVLWPVETRIIGALESSGLEYVPELEKEWASIPPSLTMRFSWVGVTSMIAFVGLIGPWIEEILFRGIVYGWLRTRFSVMASTLVSSALFGVTHIYWDEIAAAFVTCIVTAMLYERSKSLRPAIALHVTNNMTYVFWIILYMDLSQPIPI